MTIPLTLELKEMLTSVLSSDDSDLRRRGMEDAIELMTQLELNINKAEEFLKLDDIKKGNKIVEGILKEVDKLEYASAEDIEEIEKEYIDSSEE